MITVADVFHWPARAWDALVARQEPYRANGQCKHCGAPSATTERECLDCQLDRQI